MNSKSKKYYWLKLKDDFFTTREIKKLRKVAGGDTYTIIYLKMQLLSIKKDGLIMYEGTETCITEQLSLELDEDEDNIKMTLAFLQANKLIEQLSEDEYLLNKVPESIGSETGAAERMRKMREKRNIVTPQLQGVTNSYTEIEIRDREEIDIEIDKRLLQDKEEKKSSSSSLETDEDIKLIVKEYQRCGFGSMDLKTKELLEELLEEYSIEWITESFKICVDSNKRNLKYARGILNNWKNDGGMNLGGKENGQTISGDSGQDNGDAGSAERAGVLSL